MTTYRDFEVVHGTAFTCEILPTHRGRFAFSLYRSDRPRRVVTGGNTYASTAGALAAAHDVVRTFVNVPTTPAARPPTEGVKP